MKKSGKGKFIVDSSLVGHGFHSTQYGSGIKATGGLFLKPCHMICMPEPE